MTAHLTPFQLRTELSLGELLDRRGVRPSGRKIEGQSAPCICVAVDSTTLWIYVDGASIIGPGVDRVFEKWDYASLDALQADFLECVGGVLDMPAYGNPKRPSGGEASADDHKAPTIKQMSTDEVD